MTEPIALAPASLLRLLQLTSPGLPIGAFAYSQGLEYAVDSGAAHDENSTSAWIHGLLATSVTNLDVPVLCRVHAAWTADDQTAVRSWTDLLFASRGAAELQAEDQRLGNSLARLLVTLGLHEAASWAAHPRATYVTLFALACARWQIPVAAAAAGFLFAWCESQTAAASRLVPLGQSAAQRILSATAVAIPALVAQGLVVADDDIGFAAPGQVIASALHETQYSRIFRS